MNATLLEVVEWPSIMAHCETGEAAAREIRAALEAVLELAYADGIEPPAPARLAHT